MTLGDLLDSPGRGKVPETPSDHFCPGCDRVMRLTVYETMRKYVCRRCRFERWRPTR